LRMLERDLGLRSTWFIDARSIHDRQARDVIEALVSEGHEIAVHGFAHDARIALLSADALRRGLDLMQPFQRAYGARGFRSPCLVRSPTLLAALAERFGYDSSVPDVDPRLGDRQRNAGCAYPWPYRAGSLLEIPVTLPDESYRLELGLSPNGYFDMLNQKVNWLARIGGAAVSVQHPVPYFGASPSMFRRYATWLEALARRSDVWLARLGDMADWFEQLPPPVAPVSELAR
jgi:peptidoglycan/xylan/chitin deacetylase (PgdA/CDA1 family)